MFSRARHKLRAASIRPWAKNLPPSVVGDDARLLSLPLEMFLLIADFLDMADRGCLLLCNRYLYHTLGTTIWTSLRAADTSDPLRQDFLLRLARDQPKYFFCYSCSHLHAVARVGPPGPLYGTHAQRTLRCITLPDAPERLFLCFEIHDGYVEYKFEFQHLQLTMDRHRRGQSYGIELDVLYMTKVEMSKYHNITTLLSVEPKIVSDELCLRVQQWVLVDRNEFAELGRIRFLGVCPHFQYLADFNVRKFIQCKLEHFDQQEALCPTCHPLLRCVECDVEFEFERREYGENFAALIVTKWMSLGRGVTPEDPKWRRHLWQEDQSRAPLTLARASKEHGIRASFEQDEGRSLAHLTVENACVLRDDGFRVTFQRMLSPYSPSDDCRVFINSWVQQVELSAFYEPLRVEKVSKSRRRLMHMKA